MSAETTPDTGIAAAEPAATRPMGALAILRIGGFLVLYLNAAAVFLGVMGQAIARSWLAFELTGSNAALGGVLLSFGIALLIATPWGGVAADRLPKRLVLQVSVLVLATSSAWIGLAVVFDVIQYWMLLGAGVLQAVGFALFNPARMAFLSELVPRGSVPQAVSLLLVNAEVNRVVGPALAGVVVGTVAWGTEAVFLASAGLATVGLLLTGALPPGRRRGEPSDRSPFGELADGVRYVRRHPELSALTWCGIGVTMCGMPYLAFMPTISSDLFGLGSVGYGVLSATSAVGGVTAGLLLGRRSSRARENRVFVVSGALFGLAICGLAVSPNAGVALVVLLVVGGSMLAFQTTNQSQLIALSDMEYHGRVQSLIMLSFGAFGIAALPLGLLADVIGLRWTLTGMGVGVLLFVLLFVLVSRRRVGRAQRLRDLG
ncbi:MFS transporter [Geodermatophilus sabuli]|uniref:Predicted arabinose efflux permease, MFS family n=1 Tax=Geodermatophilus sabuli TaxID=1564158 RepID=A0A285EIW5_9ACTN|nr:MFS transporter [Geodermatophilus sabuli]MBB3083649.1 MFS family permease [Geodermatophilus sabuli]SNX99079.1 Predicted arabinose efflux permease, MFS family [Geodermatophilus sabuli]